jgi:hypothetical protein
MPADALNATALDAPDGLAVRPAARMGRLRGHVSSPSPCAAGRHAAGRMPVTDLRTSTRGVP